MTLPFDSNSLPTHRFIVASSDCTTRQTDGGGQSGCRSSLNCNWDDVHSAWSLLWRDGEVLRHSAALSCWHRRMGGLGRSMEGQSQAGSQLDRSGSAWIGSSPASERSLRRREGRWEEHVGQRGARWHTHTHTDTQHPSCLGSTLDSYTV